MIDPNDENVLFNRRMILAGGAALGAAGVLNLNASALAAVPAEPLLREKGLPVDPASRVALIRRMQLRSDAGPVFWYFRGRNYAQQGANLIPLCELIFGAVMMVTPNADGSLDVVQYELGFRTALGSGKRAEKLLNPITGAMVDLPFSPVGPSSVHYDADNIMHVPGTMGGSTFTVEHVPEVFYRLGDTVCFQSHTRGRVETPGATPRVLNDMSMICSPASQALDTRVPYASAWASGSDVSDYARWLKMPPGSGTQTLRSIGEKVARYADMPEDWRAMLAAADPAMAADPIAGLSRKAATYRN